MLLSPDLDIQSIYTYWHMSEVQDATNATDGCWKFDKGIINFKALTFLLSNYK